MVFGPEKSGDGDDTSVQLVPATEVDFAKLHSLLAHAFSNTHESAPKIPSVCEIEAKYHTPHGTSYVALREEHGEYVAANGALHTPLRGPHGSYEAWMSCDTATRTSHRGRGLFLACINAIRSGLPNRPVFFGFPNLASTKGFEKIGWQTKEILPIWASWVGVGKSDEKDPSTFTHSLPERPTNQHLYLDKTLAYLDWRYPQSSPAYSRLSDSKPGASYFIITRQLFLSGRLTTLILEHLYETPLGFAQGLRAVRRFGRTQGSAIVATSPQPHEIAQLVRRGFIQVPARFNPRPVRLMGQGLGEESEELWQSSWIVSLGDWDAL